MEIESLVALFQDFPVYQVQQDVGFDALKQNSEIHSRDRRVHHAPQGGHNLPALSQPRQQAGLTGIANIM